MKRKRLVTCSTCFAETTPAVKMVHTVYVSLPHLDVEAGEKFVSHLCIACLRASTKAAPVFMESMRAAREKRAKRPASETAESIVSDAIDAARRRIDGHDDGGEQ